MNWSDFKKASTNNKELFEFVAKETLSVYLEKKNIASTLNDIAISSSIDSDLTRISSYNDE